VFADLGQDGHGLFIVERKASRQLAAEPASLCQPWELTGRFGV